MKGSKKYIKSAQGGKDRSIEGQQVCWLTDRPRVRSYEATLDLFLTAVQGGITHAFIIEFESEEDRDYYVKEDSQHAAVRDRLIASVGVDIATAQVVDFSPDAF